MKITDVRLRTVKSDNELKLKAYADDDHAYNVLVRYQINNSDFSPLA